MAPQPLRRAPHLCDQPGVAHAHRPAVTQVLRLKIILNVEVSGLEMERGQVGTLNLTAVYCRTLQHTTQQMERGEVGTSISTPGLSDNGREAKEM